MLALIFVTCAVLFLLAFATYGRFLERRFDVDDARPTPSHTDYDGVDRVPAHPAVLFGHHFSSIAGAGPIVGPIIASLAFGWAVPLAWVLLGAIFIGGVHDFSALMASLRNQARSIADIARESLSPLAHRLLMLFMWLALVYVLAAYADLAAQTFVEDGGVASSAGMFVLLAILFGLSVNRLRLPVPVASLFFVPLVFVATWLGELVPVDATAVQALTGIEPTRAWCFLLLAYCFVASVTPVWLLLQPRDYLSSFLLYASILVGLLGIIGGGFSISFPAFIAWNSPQFGPLFPILFITVACGACSGFHSLVAGGTTSKQLDKETDARTVGYGAMLVEGLLAAIALTTIMMLSPDDPLLAKDPLKVYANGIGRFCGLFGVPHQYGVSFGLLALSTFILTTLDTATRLGRYIFEEFFHLQGWSGRISATLGTLLLPAVFALIPLHDAQGQQVPAWKAIWPAFGATNQLLAGLTLLVLAVWVRKLGKPIGFLVVPLVFMTTATVYALVLLILQYGTSLIGVIAAVLFVLALLMIVETARALWTLLTAAPGV